MRIIVKLYSMTKSICDAMFSFAAVLIIAVMIIITIEVCFRYFFKHPTVWALDTTRYILVYFTFLASSKLLIDDEHIVIEIVRDNINPVFKPILQLFTFIVGAFSCLVASIFSSIMTVNSFMSGARVVDPIEIPEFIPIAIIPVGMFLMFLVFILKAFMYFFCLKLGNQNFENLLEKYNK